MPVFLCRNLDEDREWVVELEEDSILIGRDREAHIPVRDVNASKRHCCIEKRGRRFFVRDLGSRNGTFLNELRLEKGPLEDGDEIRVGRLVVAFYREAPPRLPEPGGDESREGAKTGGQSIDELDLDEEEERFLEDTLYNVEPVEARAPLEPEDAPALPRERSAPRPPARPPNAEAAGAGKGAEAAPLAASAAPGRRVEAGAITPDVDQSETPLLRPEIDLESTVPETATPETAPPETEARREAGPAGGRRGAARARWRRSFPSSRAAGPSDSASRRGVPGWLLAGSCILCLAIGFAAGRLSRERPGPPPRAGARAAPAVGIEPGIGEGRAEVASTEGRRADDSAGEEAGGSALPTVPAAPPKDPGGNSAGSDASLDSFSLAPFDPTEPETTRRALYRLCLDRLARSPTRAEFRAWLPLSPEERWKGIDQAARAERGGTPPGDAAEAFERIMGRPSLPGEIEALEARSGGDPERLGRLIASSRLYARASFRRARTREQRARSLWVDIIDRLPSEKNTETVLLALEQNADDPRPVVRALSASDRSRIGPAETGVEPRVWLRETYARFILRFPTAEEEAAGLEVIAGRPDGWRSVIEHLALLEEYTRY